MSNIEGLSLKWAETAMAIVSLNMISSNPSHLEVDFSDTGEILGNSPSREH